MIIKTIEIENYNNLNLIFGQSHFIKTVEDLHEALVEAVPNIKFGLAFAEASGSCLIRLSGTDKKLAALAGKNLQKIGVGHSFLIFLGNCFPINVLPAIKQVAEVVTIFCASANQVKVIIAKDKENNAVLGVIDGLGPKGIEKVSEVKKRKDLLRKFGYKL